MVALVVLVRIVEDGGGEGRSVVVWVVTKELMVVMEYIEVVVEEVVEL